MKYKSVLNVVNDRFVADNVLMYWLYIYKTEHFSVNIMMGTATSHFSFRTQLRTQNTAQVIANLIGDKPLSQQHLS